MQILQIKLQNFLPIRELTLHLDNQGLVLVQGNNLDDDNFESNGAGKSSIPEGIVWVLYGKTIRGLTGDDVVNRKANKNCFGFIDLIDDDGSHYRVSRYRKHYEHKNSLYVYKNNKNITPESEKSTVAFITQLLQMDYNTFISTILYSAKSFKFTTATDAEMKQAFDTMLDFEVIKKCHILAKEKKTELLAEINILQLAIESKISQISSTQQQVEELEEKNKKYKRETQEKVQQINAEIIELNDDTKVLNEEYQDQQEYLTTLVESMDKVVEVIDSLIPEETKLQECCSSIKAKIMDINSNISVSNKLKLSADKKFKELVEVLKDRTSLINNNCPVCGAKVTKKSLAQVSKEIEQQIEEYKNEILSLDSNIELLQQNLKSANDELKEYKESLDSLLTNKRDFMNLKQEIQEDVSDVKSQCSQIKTKVAHNSSLVKRLQLSVSDLKNGSSNPYKEMILSGKKLIEQLDNEMGELETQLKDKNSHKDEYEFWISAFGNSGIKSNLLDSVTPFLNERANYYLQYLASDSMEVIFDTQTGLKSGEYREKFSITVLNKNGGKRYIANSSGEQKRVDLAVNMALQDLVASRSSKRINLVWYDEIFDALDDVGCERVIELLQNSNKSSIFVTTHNSLLKSYFDNIITVVKSGGFSKLEV